MILSGQVAIITAAGSGIGRAAAIAMAREGAIVLVTDRDGNTAADTARLAGGATRSVALDVTDEAAVADLIAAVHSEHGRHASSELISGCSHTPGSTHRGIARRRVRGKLRRNLAAADSLATPGSLRGSSI